MRMRNLPSEIFFRVFSFLDARDLICSASAVCSLWREIAVDDFLWKSLVTEHFSFLNAAKKALQHNDKNESESWFQYFRWILDRKNTSVLVMGAEGGGEKDERINDVKSKLALQGFDRVETFNARISTPKADYLSSFSAILFFSYHGFDQVAIGNLLAQYVDNGGAVVLGTYSNCGRGNRLDGRWASGYDPLLLGTTARARALNLGKKVEPNHPILKNVVTFEGGSQSSHGDGKAHPDAKIIAEWSNGRPLVAELKKFTGTVVGLNFYPPSADTAEGSWQVNTDGAVLLGNALYHACSTRHLC